MYGDTMNRIKTCCTTGQAEVEMFEITHPFDPEAPIAATMRCMTCGQEFQGDMRFAGWGQE